MSIYPVTSGVREITIDAPVVDWVQTLVDWDGTIHTPSDLSLDPPDSYSLVAEHDLLAFCNSSGNASGGVSLQLVDEQLTPVSERVQVLINETLPGLLAAQGCDVAWSGSEFLVVWTEANDRLGTLHAQIVPMPALTR